MRGMHEKSAGAEKERRMKKAGAEKMQALKSKKLRNPEL